MQTVIAYTDGSAVVSGANKGKGGFGVYFPNLFGKKKGLAKGYEQTKTGRTEILALYHAIKAIPLSYSEAITLQVWSDSQYVVKAFTEKRLQKWISNGWTNSSGSVKNRDLWEGVLRALKNRPNLTLDINWIKAHQVEKATNIFKKKLLMQDEHIIGNIVADKLANRWRLGKLNKSDKV